VAESCHELLATNVTLDQARSSEHLPKRDEQLPRSRRVIVGKAAWSPCALSIAAP
jgi:hypothetical protein